MKSGSNSNRFYGKLAPVYDLKVDWKKRHGKEQPLFSYLIDKLQPAAVLDIGCGDGGHAPLYSAAGVTYWGIDLSQEMVEKAALKNQGLPGVKFKVGDMSRLPVEFKRSFDQIIILGNTLPHLLTEQSLAKTFAGLGRTLRSGGHLAIQTVNPAPMKKKLAHFLPPKLSEDTFFAPFYIKSGHLWDFFMPIYRIGERGVALQSAELTHLRFWSKSEIVGHASRAGLKLAATFGSAQLDKYQPIASENMILIFKKV